MGKCENFSLTFTRVECNLHSTFISKDEFLVVTFFPSEVLFRSSSRTLYEEKVRIYREAKTYCLVRFVSFVGVYTKRSHEVSLHVNFIFVLNVDLSIYRHRATFLRL